ncbi:MAG: hypothetical protein Q9201_007732 [Fulgogasparrea decipioides]
MASGQWTMILDKVDDPALLTTDTGDLMREAAPLLFIAPSSKAERIYTGRVLQKRSCDSDAAFRLIGRDRDIIKVEPVEESHVLRLLRKKIDGKMEKGDVVRLV